MSFIFVGPEIQGEQKQQRRVDGEPEKIRIISDSFPLGNSKRQNLWGRYGCSEYGLALVSGSSESLGLSPPGTLEKLPVRKDMVDEKSGAYIAFKS